MNSYINKVVPLGTENKMYNCECGIVEGYGYADWVGFKMSGGRIKSLWDRLSGVSSSSLGIEFKFRHSGNIALAIFSRNKARVDHYMKFLDAPTLFEDNDKI